MLRPSGVFVLMGWLCLVAASCSNSATEDSSGSGGSTANGGSTVWILDGSKATFTGDTWKGGQHGILPNGHTIVAYSTKGVLHEVDSNRKLLQEMAWPLGAAFGYVQKRPTLHDPPPRQPPDCARSRDPDSGICSDRAFSPRRSAPADDALAQGRPIRLVHMNQDRPHAELPREAAGPPAACRRTFPGNSRMKKDLLPIVVPSLAVAFASGSGDGEPVIHCAGNSDHMVSSTAAGNPWGSFNGLQ
jgi:hypothetical protein